MFEKLFGRKSSPKPAAPVPNPKARIIAVVTTQEPPPAPAVIRYRRHADDPAPIIDEPDRRGYDVDFRREGDEPFIFRVNQHQPKGFPKKLANYVAVAGVSFRQMEVIEFIRGRNRCLSVRPEVITGGQLPALAVIGQWADWIGGRHEALLGYLPNDVREAIGDTPVALTLEAMYQATDERSAGLRVDVWQPRPKKTA